jgi:hypothetical protein
MKGDAWIRVRAACAPPTPFFEVGGGVLMFCAGALKNVEKAGVRGAYLFPFSRYLGSRDFRKSTTS